MLKRVFEIDMQHCPNCCACDLKSMATVLERPVIEKVLAQMEFGLPTGRSEATRSGLRMYLLGQNR